MCDFGTLKKARNSVTTSIIYISHESEVVCTAIVINSRQSQSAQNTTELICPVRAWSPLLHARTTDETVLLYRCVE